MFMLETKRSSHLEAYLKFLIMRMFLKYKIGRYMNVRAFWSISSRRKEWLWIVIQLAPSSSVIQSTFVACPWWRLGEYSVYLCTYR